MACREAALHGHGHSHGHSHGHDGDGDDDHDDDAERGNLFTLYRYIDTNRVRLLNGGDPSFSGSEVFRPWDARLMKDPGSFFESDDMDPEMLLFVPFTASVKIRALVVIGGGGGGLAPKHVKLFVNQEASMDFNEAQQTKAAQEIELVEDADGRVEYVLKPAAKFSSVHSLTFFFDDQPNNDDIPTRVNYIGLKGDFGQHLQRREAVLTVYESRPQLQDHTVPGTDSVASGLGH